MVKKAPREKGPAPRFLKPWMAAIAGAIAAIALFLSNLNTILTTVCIWIPDGLCKPHLEIVELKMSSQLRDWNDLSDQLPSILDDIRRLEKARNTNDLDSFAFQSRRYKGHIPRDALVWYPAVRFMEQSKLLFDWGFDSDRRLFEDNSLSREPLLVDIGFRNNTNRPVEITRARLRINKASMNWTSAGTVIELQPGKHLPAATKISFSWPISPKEPREKLFGVIDTPREDLATFVNALLIDPNTIERVLIQIDIPKFDFFGRQHALVQLFFSTSEGELPSDQIYITTTERAYGH